MSQATHYEDEDEIMQDEIIRAKWTIDGATTLAEAAQKAREFADHLDQMAADGYVLTGPVEDDYGFVRKA